MESLIEGEAGPGEILPVLSSGPVLQPAPPSDSPQPSRGDPQTTISNMSSDAILPPWDSSLFEESADKEAFCPLIQSSSPSTAICSSPPSAEAPSHSGPGTRWSPRSRSQKCELSSTHDSGYSSEPNWPRTGRGRAEEEIALLRRPSCKSPSSNRSTISELEPISPPPLCQTLTFGSQMLSPLTLTVKLEAYLRQDHEKVRALQSPARETTRRDENLSPWPPTFISDDAASTFRNLCDGCDDFGIAYRGFPTLVAVSDR
jgi:hypothetical protein